MLCVYVVCILLCVVCLHKYQYGVFALCVHINDTHVSCPFLLSPNTIAGAMDDLKQSHLHKAFEAHQSSLSLALSLPRTVVTESERQDMTWRSFLNLGNIALELHNDEIGNPVALFSKVCAECVEYD